MVGRGNRVFVTGVNGFVASHIVSDLIEDGYNVVGSVRTEAKGREILERHPSWKDNLSFVYIADIAAEDAYEKMYSQGDEGFDYIIHTASPVTFHVQDVQKNLIDPAVRGTIALMKCAHELGGSRLKRLVLLGSAVAVLNSFEDASVDTKNYTEDDWNPVTADQAIKANDSGLAYIAGKKLAEQAAWEFVKEEKPTFDMAVINPDVIIGPMLQQVSSPKSVNETNMFAVYNFLNGTYTNMDDVKFPFYDFVDVRDVARAHIIAMTSPAAAQQRILLISGVITPQLVANIIHKHFPELRERVIKGKPDQIFPRGVHPMGWDVSRSRKILGGAGWTYIDLEQSVVDTVRCLLELEKEWDKP